MKLAHLFPVGLVLWVGDVGVCPGCHGRGVLWSTILPHTHSQPKAPLNPKHWDWSWGGAGLGALRHAAPTMHWAPAASARRDRTFSSLA